MNKINVEEIVERIFSKEAFEQPTIPVYGADELPKWFDEKKYNQGRRFYWDYFFVLSTSMALGVVSVLAMPSVLRVLVATRRSSSECTAYTRYTSTLLNMVSWFQHDLKPGSESWKSLLSVRSRHHRISSAGKLSGYGVVSQRDLALSQNTFIAFSMLKMEQLGLRQLQAGDWEAYNHTWRVIGYMIGIDDNYNICQGTIQDTREICKRIQQRVIAPCLASVPEHFEHMARMFVWGLANHIPTLHADAALFLCKHLSGVPGYIYTERDRVDMEHQLLGCLDGKPFGTGIDAALLMSKAAIEVVPPTEPTLLYLHHYGTVEDSPTYKKLPLLAKLSLNQFYFIYSLNSTYLGRICSNFYFHTTLWFVRHLPVLALIKFGTKIWRIDHFKETPKDDAQPKTNAEYYEEFDKRSSDQSKSFNFNTLTARLPLRLLVSIVVSLICSILMLRI